MKERRPREERLVRCFIYEELIPLIQLSAGPTTKPANNFLKLFVSFPLSFEGTVVFGFLFLHLVFFSCKSSSSSNESNCPRLQIYYCIWHERDAQMFQVIEVEVMPFGLQWIMGGVILKRSYIASSWVCDIHPAGIDPKGL